MVIWLIYFVACLLIAAGGVLMWEDRDAFGYLTLMTGSLTLIAIGHHAVDQQRNKDNAHDAVLVQQECADLGGKWNTSHTVNLAAHQRASVFTNGTCIVTLP